MSPSRNSALPTQIREEAVEWFVAFCEEEVDTGDCKAFNDWLRRSPEHVRAYLRVSAFWEDAEDLERHIRHGIDEVVRRAMVESNVVALDDVKERRGPNAQGRPARVRHVALAAGLTAACVGLLAWCVFFRTPVYSTAAGEQRTITLADGSTVELNARSRVTVHYEQSQREIDLVEGQALFKVAKNPSRPFVVHSGGTSIRAVGTQFDVYRKHDGTVVTVVEGQVAVFNGQAIAAPHFSSNVAGTDIADIPSTPTSSGPAAVLLSAGQRLIARAHTLEAPEATNAATATAWTQGKLVFDSVPLKDVLDEFNRYLPRPLELDDPQLLSMHISGVFSVTESQQFLQFLHQRFGTVSQETDRDVRITRP